MAPRQPRSGRPEHLTGWQEAAALLQSATLQDSSGSDQTMWRNTRMLVYDISKDQSTTQYPLFSSEIEGIFTYLE